MGWFGKRESQVDRDVITIYPERLRILLYIAFWFTMFVGIAITMIFSPEKIGPTDPIRRFYGYPNICIFFDHFPAKYVLPSMWVFVCAIFFTYAMVDLTRARHEKLVGKLSDKMFSFFCFGTYYEILCIFFVATTFAVSPKDSMVMHTVPFTMLISALCVLAIKNYLCFHACGYIPEKDRKLGIAYLVILIGLSVAKMVFQINALMQDGLYCTRCNPGYGHSLDIFWMIFAAILPIYIAIRLHRTAPPLVIETRIGRG